MVRQTPLLTEYSVTRDVTIGAEVRDDLRPQCGDFWFHTDGVFWQTPPRWVAIQVLRADSGGEFELLDGRRMSESIPRGEVAFGRRPLLRSSVYTFGAAARIRYRRDYMHAVAGGASIAAIDGVVEAGAADATRVQPRLIAGDCILLDNWRLLHRRLPFAGVRRIRRIWLGGKP